MSYKLFLPGPLSVSKKTYKAMSKPIIHHRSNDFTSLYKKIQPSLKKLYYTQDPVYLSTSSSWCVMEGSLRNLCNKKVLNCMNGAFSDRWHEVTLKCGIKANQLKYNWGQIINAKDIEKELSTNKYDIITIVHNETSTGTMNPIEEIMSVVKKFPEVLSIVDVVSSFTVQKIEKDNLGIDVILASSQKALALPPGLVIFSVSNRALNKAKTIKNRGYYLDFLEFQKNHEKGMTPTTPNISLIYGLESKIEEIFNEGLDNRYKRHILLNNIVRSWVKKNGFSLFTEKIENGSIGLNCIKNTRKINIFKLNNILKKNYNTIIDTGYGRLKGKTFRISNMGDENELSINTLLHQLSTILKN